jgi:hypothetical protein
MMLSVVTDALWWISQLITCIPTSKLPKSLSMGAATQQEIELMHRETDQLDSLDSSDDMGRRGQILWIRGLTRLQHQVRAAPSYCPTVELLMLKAFEIMTQL